MRQGIILVALYGLAVAFVPGSFRLQSTAGVWPDDYDLLFEPARIPLAEGSRVYSGLSNLVTGSEEQFGAAKSNFFFVGGSTNLTGPFYPGLLFDRWATKTPLFTGLVSEGDSLFGEGQLINQQLFDRDTNGTYDYQILETESARAHEEQTESDYHLGVGFRTGELRLGAAFTRHDLISAMTAPWCNYRYQRRDSNFVANRLVFVEQDTAVGRDEFSQSLNRFTLNGWYDLATVRFGLLGSFTLLNQQSSLRIDAQDWINRSPSDPTIIDYARESYQYRSLRPAAGNRIDGMLSLFYSPTEIIENRFMLIASTQSLKLATDAGGLDLAHADSVRYPGRDSAADTVRFRYAGNYQSNSLELRTRHLFRISDRFRVGFGLGFTLGTAEDSLVDSTATRTYFSHNNGDTIAGREDYRRVQTSSAMWQYRVTRSDNVLSAPIGLEFNIIEPLVLRLGVDSRINWHSQTSTNQLLAVSPTLVRTDYGDGTFTETLGPAPTQPGTSETVNSTTYSNTFAYGLGYSPVPNLQIDVMGFARLTDLTNWRLSVTLKF